MYKRDKSLTCLNGDFDPVFSMAAEVARPLCEWKRLEMTYINKETFPVKLYGVVNCVCESQISLIFIFF